MSDFIGTLDSSSVSFDTINCVSDYIGTLDNASELFDTIIVHTYHLIK